MPTLSCTRPGTWPGRCRRLLRTALKKTKSAGGNPSFGARRDVSARWTRNCESAGGEFQFEIDEIRARNSCLGTMKCRPKLLAPFENIKISTVTTLCSGAARTVLLRNRLNLSSKERASFLVEKKKKRTRLGRPPPPPAWFLC